MNAREVLTSAWFVHAAFAGRNFATMSPSIVVLDMSRAFAPGLLHTLFKTFEAACAPPKDVSGALVMRQEDLVGLLLALDAAAM